MDEIQHIVMVAIAQKRTLAVRYNGVSIKLAPHLLFTRHGDLFVSALNLSKPLRANSEPRLGQFKLAGLAVAKVLEESFDQITSYQPIPPRSSDTLIMTI